MKPKFLNQIQNTTTNQGEMARFECQCAPINDPNLRIEWLHNGRPITIGYNFQNYILTLLRLRKILKILGHRFIAINDFGYVTLILLYALPEDTGEYTARAINSTGMDETKAGLLCAPKASVITESQIPQGMSVADISKDIGNNSMLHWYF